MVTVNFISVGNATNDESNLQLKNTALDSNLTNINRLLIDAENIEVTLDQKISFATPMGVTDALMAASLHQKQIVAQMMGSNPEDAIALALAASIEAYGKQLEAINAWTEGGVAVVEPLLQEMADAILLDGVEGSEYEDLIQIMIMDMMIHDDLPSGWSSDAGYFLESAGSGAHSPMTQATPEDLEELMSDVYEYALNELPAERLAHQVAVAIDPVAFYEYQSNFAETYWTNPEGFIDGFNGDSNSSPTYGAVGPSTRISPFLKLVLIGSAASEEMLSAEGFEELAQAQTVDEVKDILNLPPNQNITAWINDNADEVNSWQGKGKDGVDGDGQVWWNFPGVGITSSYLDNLFLYFPPRQLTEEEIEEVNRIGDQVKMLQQTLKYWLQICRDEQMSIAQNIA